MFLSKCLVSKKGPLGAIWVAAYFFKKLKRPQILETNISSSVDNLLQDQLEILAYRVLAYLLLGVVRIYSKKVEYLFDDCQEVLIRITEFVVREKNRAKKEALRTTSFSITRPVSFDLDAFDLEILEDFSGDNAVPREDITLKDVPWKNAAIRQSSKERFAPLDDHFLRDYAPTEDCICHWMDIETEATTSLDVCDSEATVEKLQYDKSLHEKANRVKYNDCFSLADSVNPRNENEEDPLVSFKPLLEDQSNRKGLYLSESDNEMKDHVSIVEASALVPELAGLENHKEREGSREKCNYRSFSQGNLHSEAEGEPLSYVKLIDEDQANREKPDMKKSDNEVDQVMEEDHVSILESRAEVSGISGSKNHLRTEVSGENYRDKFSEERQLNLFAEIKNSASLIKPSSEEKSERELIKCLNRVQLENKLCHHMEEDCNFGLRMRALQGEELPQMNLEEPFPLVEDFQTGAEQVNFPVMTTSKDRKCQVAAKDHKLSVTLHATPLAKSQDASGATTPHFMLIPTPAGKEHTRFSRKRKCLFDDVIVFPNDVIRQWIKDASDLVSKRGKGGRTALAARKTCLVSNLPQSFSEPSVPCAGELKFLYYGKRLRLQKSIMKIDTPEPPAVAASLEQAEIAPQIVEIRDPPDNSKHSGSPLLDGSSEHIEIAPKTPTRLPPTIVGEQVDIAPQTPVLHSKSSRLFESLENLRFDNLYEVGSVKMDPTESIQKDPLMEAVVEKESSFNDIVEKQHFLNETVDKEPSMSKDEDLELNLEINSNEDGNEGQDGWSTRTRMVAKQLKKCFLNQRKKGKKEHVMLSQLLEGRMKKASARLFYEILVLKTKGVVDVKQDSAFGDIVVLKTPHN